MDYSNLFPQVGGVKILAYGLAVLLLAGGGWGAGYHFGGLSAEKQLAEAKEGFVADQLNNIQKQLELQAQGSAQLDKRLSALPKESTVREIVKDNPSGCVLPPAVVDGLRKHIDATNAARDGS